MFRGRTKPGSIPTLPAAGYLSCCSVLGCLFTLEVFGRHDHTHGTHTTAWVTQALRFSGYRKTMLSSILGR